MQHGPHKRNPVTFLLMFCLIVLCLGIFYLTSLGLVYYDFQFCVFMGLGFVYCACLLWFLCYFLSSFFEKYGLSVCLFFFLKRKRCGVGWGKGGQALSGEDGQALSRGMGGQALSGGGMGGLWVGKGMGRLWVGGGGKALSGGGGGQALSGGKLWVGLGGQVLSGGRVGRLWAELGRENDYQNILYEKLFSIKTTYSSQVWHCPEAVTCPSLFILISSLEDMHRKLSSLQKSAHLLEETKKACVVLGLSSLFTVLHLAVSQEAWPCFSSLSAESLTLHSLSLSLSSAEQSSLTYTHPQVCTKVLPGAQQSSFGSLPQYPVKEQH